MFDHLTETMLKSYYIAENTVGRFCADKRPLFFAYARIFLLPEEEAERLFALTQSEEVLGIESEREYHQYLRLKQFMAMGQRRTHTDTETDEIIALKGSAFTAAINCGLIHEARDVRPVACENLTYAAENGVVVALVALGVLQTEGVVYGKDAESGLKKLRNAADWNSEEGLFAALFYDAERRERYIERLYGCLKRIGHVSVFEQVKAVYGPCPEGGHREYMLLEKAFRQGLIKRETYNKSYARLVYSEILGARDKEALLLTPNKELFAEASSLPLKLGHGMAALRAKALEGVRIDHPEETNKVLSGLSNIDLRTMSAYRPLLFVSDSRFMLDLYAEIVPACFDAAHAERIEVGDLVDYDFEPTKNNIFVRSCDEDALNIYLMFFCGDIAEKACDLTKNFLESGKRGKFRLNHPGVALDLSAVLPVCFCDRENAKKLLPLCDVVRIARPTAKEKRLLAEAALQKKGKLYGVKELTVQEGLMEKLEAYSIDEIDRALDEAVREHRAAKLLLTEAELMPYFKGMGGRNHTYGFGGSIHDVRE